MKKGKSKKANEAKQKPKEEKKEEDDVYTQEECERLDKFHDETEHKFTDDEVYELMLKYKDDDEAILNELKDQLKERKRGDDYDWKAVGKSKYKNF